MNNQELQAINLKMQKIEHQFPNTYQRNKKWNILYAQRETVTVRLMQSELDYLKQKVDRLIGYQKDECEKLIKQYENYLKNHIKGENNGIE